MTAVSDGNSHQTLFIVLACLLVGVLIFRAFDVSAWLFGPSPTDAPKDGAPAAPAGERPGLDGTDTVEATEAGAESPEGLEGRLMAHYHPHPDQLSPQQDKWFERIYGKKEEAKS